MKMKEIWPRYMLTMESAARCGVFASVEPPAFFNILGEILRLGWGWTKEGVDEDDEDTVYRFYVETLDGVAYSFAFYEGDFLGYDYVHTEVHQVSASRAWNQLLLTLKTNKCDNASDMEESDSEA
jgi:hypothetical protein